MRAWKAVLKPRNTLLKSLFPPHFSGLNHAAPRIRELGISSPGTDYSRNMALVSFNISTGLNTDRFRDEVPSIPSIASLPSYVRANSRKSKVHLQFVHICQDGNR